MPCPIHPSIFEISNFISTNSTSYETTYEIYKNTNIDHDFGQKVISRTLMSVGCPVFDAFVPCSEAEKNQEKRS
jgi:hypothetical protein